jgi:hypothetical protein
VARCAGRRVGSSGSRLHGPSHITDSERGALMAFRTNYRLERAERDRIKKAKKEEKLKRQQERATVSPTPDSPGHPDENTPADE